MKLLEVATVEELAPRHVTQLERLIPRARSL
jgi:L-lactate dehydrogenase (cytochrome)